MQHDKAGLYDIYGMVAVTFWQTRIFIAGLLSLVILMGLLFLIWYCYYKPKRQPTTLESLKILYKKVNESANAESISAGIYFELIAILKKIYKNSYGADNLKGHTEEELLSFIHQSGFIKELSQQDEFTNFFNRATLIRFASQKEQKQQLLTDINLITSFVRTIEKYKTKK